MPTLLYAKNYLTVSEILTDFLQDVVFDETSNNEQIYNRTCRQLVDSTLEGYVFSTSVISPSHVLLK